MRFTGIDLCTLEADEPREVWGPILRQGYMSMLFGKPGDGKTWLTIGLALAIANGGEFLRWKTNKSKVLYFDGEMGFSDVKKRILKLTPSDKPAGQVLGNIAFETSQGEERMPNFSTKRGQQWYLQRILEEKADVVFFDNLLTLSQTLDARDGEPQIWQRIEPFLWDLTRQYDKTVVLVHHAGKSGDQLGTIMKEVLLQLNMQVRRSGLEKRETGEFFELMFRKKRGVKGTQAEDIFYELKDSEDESRVFFDWSGLEKRRRDKVLDWNEAGYATPADISSALRISVREVKEIIHNGYIDEKIEDCDHYEDDELF